MKKSITIQYNAPVILTFSILTLIVHLLGLITNQWTTTHLFSVYRSSLLDPLFYIRLFGHVLGHVSLEHLLGNIMLLLVVGPLLEEKYGSRNLLLSFAVTALVTGIVHCILSPSSALLGASGLVFMCILLSSVSGVRSGEIPLTLILVAIFYLGSEIYDGITKQDTVSHLTHILGGFSGTAFGFFFLGQKKSKRKGL